MSEVVGRKAGGFMMDLRGGARTTKWAPASANLRSRFPHHIHTHTVRLQDPAGDVQGGFRGLWTVQPAD